MSLISRRAWTSYLCGGREALRDFPECRALSASEVVSGGYLVPPAESMKRIENGRAARNPIRRLATVHKLPRPTKGARCPSTDTPPTATWRTSENASIPWDTTTRTGARNFTIRPMECNFRVANSLLRASGGLADMFVSDETARAFAKLEEAGFINGDGHRKPLGVFCVSEMGINTDRDVASGSATGCSATGLRNAAAELGSDYFPNSTWLMHPDFWFKTILELKSTDTEPIFDGERMTLLSRPVVLSDECPSTFTDGLYAAILGDFQAGYWIVDSPVTPRDATTPGYIAILAASELFAEEDETGFRGIAETDGFPVRASAFVRVKCST